MYFSKKSAFAFLLTLSAISMIPSTVRGQESPPEQTIEAEPQQAPPAPEQVTENEQEPAPQAESQPNAPVVAEQPAAEPASLQPVAEQPVAEQPVVQQPGAQEPVAQQPPTTDTPLQVAQPKKDPEVEEYERREREAIERAERREATPDLFEIHAGPIARFSATPVGSAASPGAQVGVRGTFKHRGGHYEANAAFTRDGFDSARLRAGFDLELSDSVTLQTNPLDAVATPLAIRSAAGSSTSTVGNVGLLLRFGNNETLIQVNPANIHFDRVTGMITLYGDNTLTLASTQNIGDVLSLFASATGGVLLGMNGGDDHKQDGVGTYFTANGGVQIRLGKRFSTIASASIEDRNFDIKRLDGSIENSHQRVFGAGLTGIVHFDIGGKPEGAASKKKAE